MSQQMKAVLKIKWLLFRGARRTVDFITSKSRGTEKLAIAEYGIPLYTFDKPNPVISENIRHILKKKLPLQVVMCISFFV